MANSGRDDINMARLNALAASSLAIQRSETEDDVMQAVLTALAESGFENAVLSLVEGNSSRIVGHVASGSRWASVVDMTARHLESNDILAEVLRSRQSVFIPDSRCDPRCEADFVRNAGIRAQFVAPLYVGEKNIGTLQVDLGDREKLAPDESLLLEAFSSHIAVAISRLRSLDELSHLASSTKTPKPLM